ncbi:MAG: TonB-dependent receptor plug domain-containing protein [Chitinophagaceae bacterium]
MKKMLLLGIVVICAFTTYAQYEIRLTIKKSEQGTPLMGATAIISSINKTSIADSSGTVIFTNVKVGTYIIKVSYAGLEDKEISVQVPLNDSAYAEVFLEEKQEQEEQVVVTSTRISRTIKDIPTRVETISGEELAEKANMKPGDIRMMLNESTGIQTQQTSATSYNSSIRIQGLDGRYTQILRDGFPMYSGFAGGLSLMQIAPLDLKQVEVIKGSSSTLYGGGAIAGLVNLVSKTPSSKPELNFIANGTSAKGLDLSGFYSRRYKQIGLTVFGSRNTNGAYDPANIGLTAIPKFARYTINPRLFIYGSKTNANIGFSYITEKRTGGSIDYIKHNTPGYFEKNNTDRFTTQLDIQHKINDNSSLQFKSSYANFNRLVTVPAYIFEGVQQSSYSEFNFTTKHTKAFWITGINFLTDDFNEKPHNTNALRDYHYNTFGVFVQNTWTPYGFFSLETGVRGDYVKQYGLEILPRLSAMFKINPKFTARLGGGFGYKTPTVFNEDAEKLHFENVLPINQQTAKYEKSTGGNLDVNYRTKIGAVGFTINQLFFFTQLKRPLILTVTPADAYEFVNANGHMDTRGIETNLRFTYSDFKLFIGYTYADVNSHFNNVKSWLPLTARHRLNNVLMYEWEGQLKIGLEAYYFSPQKLSDGAIGKSYWICGAMAEKFWKRFSLFINFENILDARQTRFDTIYTGTIDNPVFRDIYAPVDGFVVNGGLKLRLWQ